MVHGHLPLADALQSVVDTVAAQRRAGTSSHPLNRLAGERWLQRYGWMDALGARWWPILGAGYVIVAAKRVQGMRLLEPSWRKAPRTAGAQVQVARRH